MPRIRSVKPEFFTDADVGALPPLHRQLFQGLWCFADRDGITEDKPRELKVKIVPYDDCDADSMLWDLHDAGFIIRYENDGARFLQIPALPKHQKFHKDEKPRGLPPPQHPASTLLTRGKEGASRPISCLLDTVSCELSLITETEPVPASPVPPMPSGVHDGLEERLGAVFKRERKARYKGNPRDYEGLRQLEDEDEDDIEARWVRALRHEGFPKVATLADLARYWDHFATDQPQRRPFGDPRRAPIRAEDMRHGEVDLDAKI